MDTSSRKLKTYIFQYFQREDIVKKFKSLRKKIGIPIDGFKLSRNSKVMDIWGPDPWVRKLNKKGAVKFNFIYKTIDNDLKKMCGDFLYTYPHETARLFFFYNKIITSFLDREFINKGNFTITSIHPISKLLKRKGEASLMKKDKLPIIIKMSPFLSQRETVDLIKTKWGEVEYLKKLYTTKKVNVRSRITLERDQFIYENKSLKRKEIAKLVLEKFSQTLDAIQIRKIISKEKKIRSKRDSK